MNLLVIGASGQLGRAFARAAAETLPGVTLTAAGRADIDLADPANVAEPLVARRFDAVVNFAAYHQTDDAEANAAAAFAMNAQAVRAIALVCAEKDVPFYHVSTDYVFGGDDERATPYRENDAMAPLNVYGASKALGETLARNAHGRTVILRVASLFGVPDPNRPGGNFVETMLRVAAAGKPLRVVDDQIMSPTNAGTAAAILARLIAAGVDSGTYHSVNSGCVSWFGFAEEIFRQAGVAADLTPVPSSAYPTPALRPRYSVLDNAKAAAAAGPIPDWREGLETYLRATGRLALVRG